jgi:hypothetical protein
LGLCAGVGSFQSASPVLLRSSWVPSFSPGSTLHRLVKPELDGLNWFSLDALKLNRLILIG